MVSKMSRFATILVASVFRDVFLLRKTKEQSFFPTLIELSLEREIVLSPR